MWTIVQTDGMYVNLREELGISRTTKHAWKEVSHRYPLIVVTEWSGREYCPRRSFSAPLSRSSCAQVCMVLNKVRGRVLGFADRLSQTP